MNITTYEYNVPYAWVERTWSMNNPEVERAAEFRRIVRRNALPAACDIERSIDALETGLLLAGLLRTEADRLNAELADAMVAYGNRCGSCTFVMNESWDERVRVWAAMRAILDARKPKERWTVVRATGGWWQVNKDGVCACSFPADAEPEARAYVARKNAEERAK